MSTLERRRIELEWRRFKESSLTPPRRCRTLDELRECVALLCQKMEEFQVNVGYVPGAVYALLSQYTQQQNKLLSAAYYRSYGSL